MTMPAMDPQLREGYETGRRMLRRHDPTYYFATRRLPPELRPATHALYGYVRTADQIVDGPRRPPTPAARRAALDAWEAELHAGHGSSSPVVRALADAARRHAPAAVGAGHRTCARCASTARRCGSPAGRSSSPTWTARPARSGGSWRRCSGVPPDHHADFGRLGIAFQLANFIRDVARGPAAGPHLPARRGPRALRGQRGPTWPRPRPARSCARWSPTRSPAPAGCSPPPARRSPPRRVRAAGHPVRHRALPADARPRRGERVRRARPRAPACASGTSRARRGRRCGEARHAARRRADAAGRLARTS